MIERIEQFACCGVSYLGETGEKSVWFGENGVKYTRSDGVTASFGDDEVLLTLDLQYMCCATIDL